jgi:hypothetical protein
MHRLFRVSFVYCALLWMLGSEARADFMFSFGGHSYQLVQQNRNWLNAAADAASRNSNGAPGGLAVIETAAENQAIRDALLANLPSSTFSSTIAPDGGQRAYVWIGGSDRVTEGTWLWDANGDGAGIPFWQGTGATGAAVSGRYHSWGNPGATQREPDNSQNLQDALGMSLNGWPFGVAGEWNDVNEANTLFYVVEFTPVPEPSTIVIAAMGLSAMVVVAQRRRRSVAG